MDMETSLEEKIQNNSAAVFWKKYHAFFLAPLIVLFLYVFALIGHRIFPFGEYTLASYDLSAQICPFIEHLFDVLEGKSSLTYSYAIAGGADVTGTFLYFFISPFSFLFLIFGDGKVAQASSIVLGCKLTAIAFAGAWFAKKLFNGIPDYICVAIGVVYAYCGYTFVSNTYINWMDFLILMPFCAWAFTHFVKTNCFLPFSLLMAACIYTCFSIACFSMFTVFPALVVYALFCVEKKKKYSFIAYLCLSFVIAVLLCLPVLLPALAAYLRSGRGGGLFENLWYGFSVDSATSELGDFNSSSFLNTWSTSMYRKWSYIVSDSVFVVLTFIWFFRKGVREPFARFMAVAGVFTLLPLVVDEAMNLMNMGSYMSYALRFGFLNALYFLGGACLCLQDICYRSAHAFDGTPLYCDKTLNQDEIGIVNEGGRYALNEENALANAKGKRKYYAWAGVLFALCLAAILFIVWYARGNYQTFLANFTKDKEETMQSLKNFPSAFAHSLGGVEVIVFPFAIVAVVTVFGAFLVGGKKLSPRALSFALIAVVGVQVVFYNNQLVIGDRSTQHQTMGHFQTLCAELNEREDGYFRVKDYDDKLTACAPFTAEFHSFSVFSSVIDKDNFEIYHLFGYKGNGKNSLKSAHDEGKRNRAEEFGDSFLGYKYFIVPKEKTAGADENPLLKKVMTTVDGKEAQLSSGEYYVYENTAVFPLGYRVQNGAFTFAAPNIANSNNRKENQAALYAFLRGEELDSVVVSATQTQELSEYLWSKAAKVEVGAGKIRVCVTAEAGECLFLNFVASKGYLVTVNGKKAELVENDLHFLCVALNEGENEVVFTYSSPYVKYAAIGAGVSLATLCAAAFVLKKTRIMERIAPVIAWSGVVLATAVVVFFMIYPTGVFLGKLLELAKGFFLK